MLFPYYNDYQKGNLSKFCRSYDYHKLILNKLKKICILFKKQFYNNIFMPYVDVTIINEVKAAYISGTGILGKNGLILDEKYGPFVFIGEIITDLNFILLKKTKKKCIKCNFCLKECPVSLKKNLCISKINQSKGKLNNNEKLLIKKSQYIWGCDLCIDICHKINNFENASINNIFKKDLIRNIYLNDINLLTNKTFKYKYFNRAFIWRRKSVLERNLLLKATN